MKNLGGSKSNNPGSADVSAGDLRLPKLSHMVADRLRSQIASGEIGRGSKLPPESELLNIFKVSRPTLREALRILEAESLISSSRGMRSGAIVRGPSMLKATEYATLILASEGVTMFDLHQARSFFEPAIVRSLKGNMSKKALGELRACVEDIEKALADKQYAQVVDGTNRFHEALAKASGNRTIALLIGMLQSISDDAFAANLVDEGRISTSALQKNMQKTVAGYRTLCELLEDGKTDEAADFWRQYMERAGEFLKKTKLGERRVRHNSGGGGSQ